MGTALKSDIQVFYPSVPSGLLLLNCETIFLVCDKCKKISLREKEEINVT